MKKLTKKHINTILALSILGILVTSLDLGLFSGYSDVPLATFNVVNCLSTDDLTLDVEFTNLASSNMDFSMSYACYGTTGQYTTINDMYVEAINLDAGETRLYTLPFMVGTAVGAGHCDITILHWVGTEYWIDKYGSCDMTNIKPTIVTTTTTQAPTTTAPQTPTTTIPPVPTTIPPRPPVDRDVGDIINLASWVGLIFTGATKLKLIK